MRNFRLTIEYDGTDFAGWQFQPDARTVQGELERAASLVTRAPVRLAGAGRTDAGVHARGQVASFYSESDIEPRRLLEALNGTTPSDLAVRAVEEADWDFHARRSSIGKRYRYMLRSGVRPALDRRRVAFVSSALDVAPMRAAAALLVGRHDFAAFQSSDSPRPSTVRTLRRLDIQEVAPGELRFLLEADGFLYKMCRALVGTLVEVGRGAREPASVTALTGGGSRASAGANAPALGLCLDEVLYP